MKSYTDIEQSKKLAEILPLESADTWWNFYSVTTDDTTPQIIHLNTPWVGNFNWDNKPDNVPCWSLAALLEQIPSDLGSETLTIEKCDSEPFKYGLNYHDRWGREDDIQTKYYDDLVDACYEMVLKLHKQKLL